MAHGISIHSLRMEGDKSHVVYTDGKYISIHSLRMEGDYYDNKGMIVVNAFQSTPSAWRETSLKMTNLQLIHISIHSLRMEGDTQECEQRFDRNISIHSLRMEGDPV